ncbi:MAG: STAS domain-containing protein [Solirubrobacteraceae bacterium]
MAWVRVAGELDLAGAPRLERTLRGAELRTRLVVTSLRELTFVDSCGVGVMASAPDGPAAACFSSASAGRLRCNDCSR